MSLVDKLIELRRAANLTQNDVADALGVTRQTVSQQERYVTVPSTESLRKLAKLYGVPVDYLMNYDAEPEERKTDASEKTQEKRGEGKKSLSTEKRAIIILAILLGVSLIVNGILAVIVYNYKANELTFDEMQREELEQSELDEAQDFTFWW